MKSTRLLVATFVTCVALSGFSCSETATPCACTEEFRTYVLTVLDDARQPEPDVRVTRVNQRTGDTLTSGWLGMLVPAAASLRRVSPLQ
jgi:hypothetical protein